MIRIAFVRGAFLNNFEAQNYCFSDEIEVTGIGSFTSMHKKLPFPVKLLPSPADLGRMPVIDMIPLIQKGISYISNRACGDSQVLFGIEKYAKLFDIFHTADPHYYYSYQLARLRASGAIKRLIVTSWETIPFNNETVKNKKYIKRYVLRHADRFLCYTECARDTLVMEGVNPTKIDVVPLGVNLRSFSPSEQLVPNRFRILFVGRLVEEKGILDLYEAFKQLKINLSNKGKSIATQLHIVGKGNLQRHLEYLIATDGLQNEVCIESRGYQDVPSAYRESDIFVMPSKHTKTWEEQYGMVLPEAMASGLPVLAYDSGAIAEVVGTGGIVIPENNSTQLVNYLTRLAIDEKERRKWRSKALKRAQTRFDSNKIADSIGRIYQKLVS